MRKVGEIEIYETPKGEEVCKVNVTGAKVGVPMNQKLLERFEALGGKWTPTTAGK
jgi:hypothetical protein